MYFNLPLRLIPSTGVQPVRAGYLAGSDVGAWLTEMARHSRARFFVVPCSEDDLEAGGLLILPADSGKEAVAFGGRVLPCSLEYGCVVVPSGMRLDPALSSEEANRLLKYSVYFFHPTMGLVAFDEADAISTNQLIVPPLVRETSWFAARMGHTKPPPLNRVMLLLPDDPADLFGEASHEIGGSSPKDLLRQDSVSKRLKDKMTGGAAALASGLLGGLGRLLNSGKKTNPAQAESGNLSKGLSRGVSMLDRLGRWTLGQLEKLQRQREGEINRLLELLENDPEKGLRYALPCTDGSNSSRGKAPPSGRLSEREPIFGRKGRSGASDVWSFSDQARFELQKKYRDLANRELAEGRFDRAAYIFAELLGDWHSAAGALVRGKRYQEAARIYENRLQNRPQAAKCLEDGGLFHEALLIYADLGQHEKCGDLLRRIGQEREAVAAYQEAIKGSSDRLHDARILFEKLGQQGLAISVLGSGYPHSAQACACLEKQFDYLQQLQAHDEASYLARGLVDASRQLSDPLTMAKMLKSIHESYLEPEVSHCLSTVAIGFIGSALSKKPDCERKLLDLLPEFAPSDQLLRRDINRYQDRRQREIRLLKRQGERPDSMSRRSLFGLPKDGTQWHRLMCRDKTWLAVGHHEKTNVDVWVSGEDNKVSGKLTSAVGWQSLLDLPPLLPPLHGVVWLPFAEKGKDVRYGQTQGSDFTFVPRTREMLLARLLWMPPGLLAAFPVQDGCWILHHNSFQTINLSFYSYEGKLIRSRALDGAPPSLPLPIFMVGHDEDIVIAVQNVLIFVKHGYIYNQIELNFRVLDLSVTRPSQPAAVLLVAGFEVQLVAPGKKSETIQLFSSESKEPPSACFLADGCIAVGNAGGLLIYSAYPQAKFMKSVHLPKKQEQAVISLAAWGAHGLAVLWEDGLVECYE